MSWPWRNQDTATAQVHEGAPAPARTHTPHGVRDRALPWPMTATVLARIIHNLG
jgi:hypothetical protein